MFTRYISIVCFIFSFASFAISNSHFEQAAQYFAQAKFPEAEIALKNSIAEEPNYIPARILLAKTYLELGKLTLAEKEILAAKNNGADQDVVLTILAKVFYQAGDYQQAQQQINQMSGMANTASMRLLGGQIAAGLAQYEQAAVLFQSVLDEPEFTAQARLGLANVYYRNSNFDQALLALNPLVTEQPENVGALLLMAELQRHQQQWDQAEVLYNRVKAIDSAHLGYLYSRATFLLETKRPDEALALTLELVAKYPKNPAAKLLHATVMKSAGDIDQALVTLNELEHYLSLFTNEQRSQKDTLIILGMMEFLADNWQRSAIHLRKYLSQYGDEATVLATLAKVEIFQGFYEQAEIYASRLIVMGNATVEDYLLLVQSRKLNKRYPEAIAELRTAVAQYPDAIALRQTLARLLVLNGQRQLAIEEIQKVMPQMGQERAQSLVTIGYLQLQEKDIPEAFVTAQQLLNEFPNKVETYQFAGEVALAQADQKTAQLLFQQALMLDAGYKPSLLSLAAIALDSGRHSEAQNYYDKILTLNPSDVTVLQLSAVIDISQRRLKAAEEKLRLALNVSPGQFLTQKSLAEVLLLQQQYSAAEQLVSELDQQYFFNPDVLYLRARIEIANKKVSQAQLTLSKLSGLTYNDLKWQLLIAHRLVDLGDTQGLEKSQKRLRLFALEDKAVESDLALLEARVALNTRNFSKSLTMANKIQSPVLKFAAIEVKAYAAIGLKEWQDALAHLIILQQQEDLDTRKFFQMELQIYLGLKEYHNAQQMLEQRLSSDPNDEFCVGQLAQLFELLGAQEQAQNTYLAFPKLNDHPVFLNNLANLYIETDNGQALKFANRAYELLPDDPNVLDTLGWAWVKSGELAKGLGFLREALSRDSGNIELLWHLAQTLYWLNRFDESQQHLNRILYLDKTGQRKSDVNRLLEKMSQHERGNN